MNRQTQIDCWNSEMQARNAQAERRLPGLGKDCRGQALVMFALLFAALFGFMGLVLDGGRLYFEKRSMQVAADAAAIAGAQELLRRHDGVNGPDFVETAAWDDATLNGYNNTRSDIDVVVNHPAPVYGATHVEVIITRRVPTTFMRVVNVGESVVRARSVAGIQLDDGPPCILALNKTASGALTASGGAILDAPTCRIKVNSNAPNAIIANGGGNAQGCNVTAYSIGFVLNGGSIQTGGGTLCPQPKGNSIPAPDPYAYMAAPNAASYTPRSVAKVTINGGTTTLLPGVYTNGIQINGGNVTFAPGLFIVGGLTATGGTITGAGVTIYNTGAGLRNIQINGNANVTLSAPTDPNDPYCNILFYNSRSIPTGNPTYSANVIGTSTSTFEGVQYFPTVAMNFGGNQVQNAPWAMIIADTLTLAGTPNLGVMSSLAPGRTSNVFEIALVE